MFSMLMIRLVAGAVTSMMIISTSAALVAVVVVLRFFQFPFGAELGKGTIDTAHRLQWLVPRPDPKLPLGLSRLLRRKRRQPFRPLRRFI